MDAVAPYAKAVLGFIAPAAALIITAVLPDSAGGEAITAGEWITALCTSVVTSAAVYAVPNKQSVDNRGL